MSRTAKKQAPRQTPIADALRAALRTDEASLYAIAEAADVPRSSITRFLGAGDGKAKTLTVETADKLAAELGLKVLLPSSRGRGGRKPKSAKR